MMMGVGVVSCAWSGADAATIAKSARMTLQNDLLEVTHEGGMPFFSVRVGLVIVPPIRVKRLDEKSCWRRARLVSMRAMPS